MRNINASTGDMQSQTLIIKWISDIKMWNLSFLNAY